MFDLMIVFLGCLLLCIFKLFFYFLSCFLRFGNKPQGPFDLILEIPVNDIFLRNRNFSFYIWNIIIY